MNAKAVLEELESHMTTSSKGKAEKGKLHRYVTTPFLDQSWEGSPGQFVLCFNEHFTELDEVSPRDEMLPFSTRLTPLQKAVHAIPELRIFETMKEILKSYFILHWLHLGLCQLLYHSSQNLHQL